MKRKIIFTFFVVIVFSSMLVQSKNKPPAISMKELTDPSSPSYVPYPFPKTEFEILEDLKYAIRCNFDSPKSRKWEEAYISKEVEKRSKEHDHLVLGLIEKEPLLFIRDIIKVTDLQAISSFKFYYLITLADKEHMVQCVAKLNDCGLLGGFMFIDNVKAFRPYLDQEKTTTLCQTKLNSPIIKKMDYVYLVSNISDFFYPLWRIETESDTFFIDYKNDIYKLKEESIPLGDGNTYYLSPDQKDEVLLFDDLNDRVRFLKKLE